MIAAPNAKADILVAFTEPSRPATPRQIAAIFERLDEASVEGLYVAALMTDADLYSAPDQFDWRGARSAVAFDEGLPWVTEIALGSPFHVRLSAKNLGKAAAWLVALGLVFNQADNAIQEAIRLVDDTAALEHAVEHLLHGEGLPRRDRLPPLRKGNEPGIRVEQIDAAKR